MKTNLKVNFKVLATNNKGEVSISLTVKGELSDEQILSLHRLKAVGAVFVDMFDGQASIEDYEVEEPRRGVRYTMKDGDVEVDNQLTIDEIEKEPTLEERYQMYVDDAFNSTVEQQVLPFDKWVTKLPLAINENADIISDEYYKEKIEAYDHAYADGEPSEDEQEIESMESEVSREEREKGELEDELPF